MKKIILIIMSILILLLLNINIYQKEQIILHGENVFLELKPVDPRSLIQGDYMRLRYNLHIDQNKIAMNNQRGYIVIGLDENKVGLFKRFYNNEQLAADEKIIKYRSNAYDIIVEPNSFMFQEGHGQIYETYLP